MKSTLEEIETKAHLSQFSAFCNKKKNQEHISWFEPSKVNRYTIITWYRWNLLGFSNCVNIDVFALNNKKIVAYWLSKDIHFVM